MPLHYECSYWIADPKRVGINNFIQYIVVSIMKPKDDLRSVTKTIRLTPAEYADLYGKFTNSTDRFFANYIRDALLLQKPVVAKYRNQSLDEFLPIAMGIRDELRALTQSLGDKLIRLNIPATDLSLAKAVEYFLAEQLTIQEKIVKIEDLLIKIYDLWSPK